MDNKYAAPIFIHSLFRSGSTYMFNAFRRSDAGYWCYQEPLSEKLIYHANKPGGFQVGVEGVNKGLRHPTLDKPYFYEFHVVAEEVVKLFRKEFSYHQYFARKAEDLAELKLYFMALLNGALGRPVFQCCRTAGRVFGLKTELSGIHIFLWRNPWDQWWSYKQDHYFTSRNLFIADAKDLPDFLRLLKKELKIPEFNNVDPSIKDAYFSNRKLDSRASYSLFYGLWCHAMLEAKPHCDISISIDSLSTSDTYRRHIIQELQLLGVGGLDFSDCAVAMARYGESDRDFFLEVENYLHRLLLSHGYTAPQVDELRRLSAERIQSLVVDTSIPENFAIRDAMRAREYLRQAEAKLSEMQNMLFQTRAQIQQARSQSQKS